MGEKLNINLKNIGTDPNLHVPDIRAINEGKEAAMKHDNSMKKEETTENKENVTNSNPMLNQNSILNKIIPKSNNNNNEIVSLIEPNGDSKTVKESNNSFEPVF